MNVKQRWLMHVVGGLRFAKVPEGFWGGFGVGGATLKYYPARLAEMYYFFS
jgi:hypothetical protein